MFDLFKRAKELAFKHMPVDIESAVIDGIYMWIAVAIMLVIFLPVLSAVHTATALNEAAPMYAQETSLITMTSSSYGLLIVVLIILAAVIILGVIAYLKQK